MGVVVVKGGQDGDRCEEQMKLEGQLSEMKMKMK